MYSRYLEDDEDYLQQEVEEDEDYLQQVEEEDEDYLQQVEEEDEDYLQQESLPIEEEDETPPNAEVPWAYFLLLRPFFSLKSPAN